MKRVSHLRSVFIELFARIVSVSFSYHEAEMIRDGRENERMRFGGIIGLTR